MYMLQNTDTNLCFLSGSLDKYLKQQQELLDRKDVLLDMATQICSALKFLEKRGIIHGDLVSL